MSGITIFYHWLVGLMNRRDDVKKRKFPKKFVKQTWYIELYKGIGFFRRKKFTIVATTPNTATRDFILKYPEAKILAVANYKF